MNLYHLILAYIGYRSLKQALAIGLLMFLTVFFFGIAIIMEVLA